MMTAEDRGRKVHRLSPREVAVELKLMDAELLRKIQPCELKEGAWMNKAKVGVTVWSSYVFNKLTFKDCSNGVTDCTRWDFNT